MSDVTPSRPPPSPLTQTLRAIRQKRGLRACDVAHRMGLALRTYEYFEAGAHRRSCEDLVSFAKAVDCDAIALLASTVLKRGDLALACTDNKAGEIFALLLDEFVCEVGSGVSRLSAQHAQTAFSRAFRALSMDLAGDGAVPPPPNSTLAD